MDQDESAEHQVFDGGIENWLEIAARGNLTPGGVLLFFGGTRILDNIVAGWDIAMDGLVRGEDGRVFSSVEHIVPPTLAHRDVAIGIRNAIRIRLELLNILNADIDKHLKVRVLKTFEATEMLEVLRTVRDGAAVAISCAELFRYPDVESSQTFTTATWYGVKYNQISRRQAYFAHLMKLTRDVLQLSRVKNLLVVLFCEERTIPLEELPEDLQHDSGLGIHSLLSSKEEMTDFQLQDFVMPADRNQAIFELESLSAKVQDPFQQAILNSHILQLKEKFTSSWEVIEPYYNDLLDHGNSEVLLAICHIATAAGKGKEARELLGAAINRGVSSFEEIHAAYLLTNTLQLNELHDELFERMLRDFPNNRRTLIAQHNHYLHTRNYAMAEPIAERLGFGFDARAWRAFKAPNLEVSELLAYAEKLGEPDRAYIAIAQELEFRNEFDLSKDWASKILPSSKFAPDAVRIRIRAVGRKIHEQSDISDDDVAELRELMHFVAQHPTNLELRFELYTLLESKIEEPAVIVILTKLILDSIAIINGTSDMQKPYSRSERVSADMVEEDSSDFFLVVFEGVLSELSGREFVMGSGEFPEPLKQYVTEELLDRFLFVIQTGIHDSLPDYSTWLTSVLHVTILLSKELGDPSKDLLAVLLVIGGLSSAGFLQDARDLGETAFQVASVQSANREWRNGEAWLCAADAFLRTGNSIAALRSLALCFLLWEDCALNRLMLRIAYRNVARTFRDLGLGEFALQMIDVERNLLLQMPERSSQLLELEQVELSIQIKTYGVETPKKTLLSTLEQLAELLRHGEGQETEPVLYLMAYLMTLLKVKDERIPTEIERDYFDELHKLSEPHQSVVRINALVNPTSEDLRTAMAEVGSAYHLSDLSYQLTAIQVLARRAIRVAAQQGDAELFLLSATLVSQPILSLQIQQVEHNVYFRSPGKATDWMNELLKQHAAPAALSDAAVIAKSINVVSRRSIKDIGQVSSTKLKSILSDEEIALVIASDSDDKLYRLIVSREKLIGPELITPKFWSSSALRNWRQFYPRGYGKWGPTGPYDRDPFPADLVKESLTSLGFGSLQLTKYLSIMPEGDLFGFPFALSSNQDHYLGEQTSLAVVPSATWLIQTRMKGEPTRASRKAWLGSPDTNNYELLYLKDHLQAPLEVYQVELVENALPIGMAESGLAVVAAHGGTGLLDYFKTVTDKTRSYSAEDFAEYFKGCGCVVLFVCNAGRSDLQHGSTEIFGLVAQLLRANVRAVVASSWPLHIYIPPIWLPTFLKSLSEGEVVARALHMASREVRARYDHPSAWAALQVYGDTMLRIPNPNSTLAK